MYVIDFFSILIKYFTNPRGYTLFITWGLVIKLVLKLLFN